MVTEINHQAIKGRIQTILMANTSLYNLQAANRTGLINNVYVGLPDGYNWAFWPRPYICITNDTNFETDKPFGAIVNTNTGNAFSTSYHTVNYNIIIMVEGPSAATVEKYLDTFHKTVKETLKSNFQFLNALTGQNDLGIQETVLSTSKYVDGGSHEGTTVNGIVINCKVSIVTGS